MLNPQGEVPFLKVLCLRFDGSWHFLDSKTTWVFDLSESFKVSTTTFCTLGTQSLSLYPFVRRELDKNGPTSDNEIEQWNNAMSFGVLEV